MKLGGGISTGSSGGTWGGSGIGPVSPVQPVTALPSSARQFTIPAQAGVVNPRCPPGYHTSIRQPRGTVYPYAVCTPLPQPIASGFKRPAPAPRPVKVTVSPTFQQQFTPQFSPTLQQQQDSPGAVQTSVPVQTTTAPQTASTESREETPPPVIAPISEPTPRGESEIDSDILLKFMELFEREKGGDVIPPIIDAPQTIPAYQPVPTYDEIPEKVAETQQKTNWLPIAAIGALLLLS